MPTKLFAVLHFSYTFLAASRISRIPTVVAGPRHVASCYIRVPDKAAYDLIDLVFLYVTTAFRFIHDVFIDDRTRREISCWKKSRNTPSSTAETVTDHRVIIVLFISVTKSSSLDVSSVFDC